MKKFVLKILNPVIALLLLNQSFTALISGALSHELFEKLHQTGGALLLLGAVIHLLLNWNWVKATYFKK